MELEDCSGMLVTQGERVRQRFTGSSVTPQGITLVARKKSAREKFGFAGDERCNRVTRRRARQAPGAVTPVQKTTRHDAELMVFQEA